MANNRPEVVVYNDTKIVDIIFIAQGISQLAGSVKRLAKSQHIFLWSIVG